MAEATDYAERHYGVKAAARYLGVSATTIRDWRDRRELLPRQREWTKAELDEARRRAATRAPKNGSRPKGRAPSRRSKRVEAPESAHDRTGSPGEEQAQAPQPSSGAKEQGRDPLDLNVPRRAIRPASDDDQAPAPPPETPPSPAAPSPPPPPAPPAGGGLFDW